MNWEAVKESISHIESLLGGGDSCGHWLYEMARSLPDDSIILEIGAYLGYSTSCLAFGCKGTRKHVYTIDTFCGAEDFPRRQTDFFAEWWENIGACDLLDYVTPLQGLSSLFYDSWDKPVSFLFIDGSHQFEIIVADFDAFSPWVLPGGYVAVHDVVPPGVAVAHPDRHRAWHAHIAPRLGCIDYYPVAHGCVGVPTTGASL